MASCSSNLFSLEVGVSVYDVTGSVQVHTGNGGYVRPFIHIPLGLEIVQ